jgi:hypothetical protein
MRLDEWSQVAGIAAIPLGIIVWLVDRKQVITFCKKWSAIIVASFAIVILYAIWQRSWFNWLVHPVTWPVWALIILGIFGFVVAFMIWFLAKLSAEIPAGIQVQPKQFNPYEYTSDEIFGVDWLWDYRGDVLGDELSAFCPNKKCMCRLTIQVNPERISLQGSGYGSHVAIPVSLNCTNCGFSRQFNSDWNKLKHDVFLEIERRVRTGEFQQRLTQNTNAA